MKHIQPGTWYTHVPALLILAVFAGMSAWLMQIKSIWFDEFFTYHISQFESWSHFMERWRHGGDINPPLLYLLPYSTQQWLGATHVGLRLPFLAAYLLAAGGVYTMVTRRLHPAYGALAMTMVLVKFRYAYEARSPALILCATSLAALAWLWRADQRRPIAALALLTISAMLAVASHYYGALVLGPIGLAELVRTWQRKQWDWAVWLCMAPALLLFAILLPVMLTATEWISNDHVAAVGVDALWKGYSWYIGGPHRLLAAALVVSALYFIFRRHEPRQPVPPVAYPLAEWALWSSMALLPVLGFLAAWTITGVFFARYFIGAAIGLSVLTPMILHRLYRGRPGAAWILAGGLFITILGQQVTDLPKHYAQRDYLATLDTKLAAVEESVPLVSLDFSQYPVYMQYLKTETAQRIICVLNAERPWHPAHDIPGLSRIVDYRWMLSTEMEALEAHEVYVIELHGMHSNKEIAEARRILRDEPGHPRLPAGRRR